VAPPTLLQLPLEREKAAAQLDLQAAKFQAETQLKTAEMVAKGMQ
jgi:hypothetical protein